MDAYKFLTRINKDNNLKDQFEKSLTKDFFNLCKQTSKTRTYKALGSKTKKFRYKNQIYIADECIARSLYISLSQKEKELYDAIIETMIRGLMDLNGNINDIIIFHKIQFYGYANMINLRAEIKVRIWFKNIREVKWWSV